MVTTKSSVDNRSVPRAHLKRRVYEAAIALFREKGYAATTTDEIARRALVAKGTVFNFFPTKPAILLHYYEEIGAQFGAAMESLSPDAPAAELKRFWGEAEALLRREGALIDAVFREVARDGDIANSDGDSGEKDRAVMIAYFRRCRERGTVDAEVEPAVAAHIVTDLWSATVMDWLARGKRYSLKLRLGAKLDALFKGLAPLVAAALLLAAGGRAGAVADKDGRVIVGDALKDPKGEAGTIICIQTGLRAEVDGESRALRRVPLAREEFGVASGAVKLAGELVHRADRRPSARS